MPTDEASRTVHVQAALEDVLATIRAVDHQPEWVPEIRTFQILAEKKNMVGGYPMFRLSVKPKKRPGFQKKHRIATELSKLALLAIQSVL